MQEQLMSDYGDHKPATRDAWNFLQVRLSCCGAKNYTDYVNSSWANHTVSYSSYLLSWLTQKNNICFNVLYLVRRSTRVNYNYCFYLVFD